MADKEDDLASSESVPLPAPPSDSDELQPEKPREGDEEPTPQPQEQQPPPPQSEIEKKNTVSSISFSIWPPSERTREAVVNRLIKTLSDPSSLSKRYGSIPRDEATSIAAAIEQESFSIASDASASLGGDDGIEILQAYSKEISKRMIDAVKARSTDSSSSAAPPERNAPPETLPSAASVVSEEASSGETEA